MSDRAVTRLFRSRQLADTALRSLRHAALPGCLLWASGSVEVALAETPVLPSGGAVVAGAARIDTAPAAVSVTQSSARAVVNWSAFSVGSGGSVDFNQPDAQSATLNRVTGTTPSAIAGQIRATGSVYLVNPNGIAITPTGTVDTGGGFVASTLEFADADFMAGRQTFTGNGASAGVSNAGTIRAGESAFVALLGGTVANSGTITVPLGKVGLGSGERIALDLNGGNFLQVAVPTSLLGNGALVDNAGTIAAGGGSVTLSAATVKNAVRNVINMSGAISADSAVADGGVIRLFGGEGGTVTVSGELSARATGAIGNGGTVETSGANVDFTGLRVDTRATAGKTGQWVVDPTDLNVDQAAADTISTNLLTTNVELDTFADGSTSGPGTPSSGAGDININGTINWNSNNTLTLSAFNDVNLNAPIHWTGDGSGGLGSFLVNASHDINFNAPLDWNRGFGLFFDAVRNINVNAALSSTTGTFVQFTADRTGTGTGAVVFASGRATGSLTTGGAVVNLFYNPTSYATPTDFSAAIPVFDQATNSGSFLFPYMLVNTVNDLQAISTNLTGYYGMVRDIDASATFGWNGGLGFAPIGVDSGGSAIGNGFNGLFYGQDHVISSLWIRRPNMTNAGLFGFLSGMVSGVSLTNLTLIGGSNLGGIAGTMDNAVAPACQCGPTSINRVSVSGLVDAQSLSGSGAGLANAGGIVGFATGDLHDSSAIGVSVSTGNGAGGAIGTLNTGLVDNVTVDSASTVGALANAGGVIGVVASGTITHLTGSAQVTSQNGGGAAIGSMFGGSVRLSSVTGQASVSGTSNLGGFVGVMTADAAIDASTSAAPVSGDTQTGTAVGGFVGTIVSSGTVSNSSASGAVVGAAFVGGFAGSLNAGGSLQGVSASNTVSGQDQVGGIVGGATAGTLFSVATTSGSVVTGHDSVGGIIGAADNATSISTVNNSATVSGHGSVGGIAGQLIGGSTLFNGQSTGAVHGSDIVVGGLVGYLSGGTIINSIGYGQVSGFAYVGGLVGNINGGAVRDSTAGGTANVSGNDPENSFWIGGLVGHASGATISGSSASGAVSGNAQIGGLVGYLESDSSIDQSAAFGRVTGTGSAHANFDIGGLVGFSAGTISLSQAGGPVSGFLYVGGLVGWEDYSGTIFNSMTNSQVTGVAVPTATGLATTGTTKGIPFQFDHVYDVGGLAGLANGTIDVGSAFGSVIAPDTSENVGGLAGEASGTITRSRALSPSCCTASSITGGTSVGGLVGTLDRGTIDGSFASLAVAGGNNVGGLVGTSDGTISNDNASGNVGGTNSVGGLLGAGTVNSLVTRSFATGPVSLGNGTGGGGLVGYDYGSVTLSYATGTVFGTPANRDAGISGSSSVGGLVGVLNGSQGGGQLSDSYATGMVFSQTIAGGLVGGNTGSITRSYATGAVLGVTFKGGLVGYNLGATSSVTSSYWDTQTTGLASGFGQNDGTFTGIGRTTADMQDLNAFRTNYAGFDFANIWAPPNQPGQTSDPTGHYPELYALSRVIWVRPDDQTRIYGAGNPFLTYSVSGLPNGFSLPRAPDLATIADTTSNVGTYAITQSGAVGPSGFRLIQTDGSLLITPRPLILTPDPIFQTYGSIPPTTDTATAQPTDASSGLVNGDTVASLGITTTATVSSGVGSYPLFGSNAVFARGLAGNYSIVYNSSDNGLTITPAPLQVTYTANAASRLFGQANPTFSGSVAASGLVNGDTLAGATSGTAVFTSPATATSNVGQYAINGSGLIAANPNYAITFLQAPGNATALTINPAMLLGTVNAALTGVASKTYDGTRTATLTPSNFALYGFVNGDGATVTQTRGSYLSANAGSGIVVTATLGANDLVANAGTNLSNYILPTSASGAIGVILPASLSVVYVASPTRRTYGQASPSLTGSYSVSGLVGGDNIGAVLGGSAVFTSAATAASNVGTYAVTGSGLFGRSGNYTYSFSQSRGNLTALTVNPASLTVYYVANTVTRQVGQPGPALTGTMQAVGLVNGDTLGSVTTGTVVFTTSATASSGPGNYAITGSGLAAASANYVIRFLQSPLNSFAYSVLPASRR